MRGCSCFFFFFLMFPNKREAAFYWFLFLIFYTFELSHERLSSPLLPFLWHPHAPPHWAHPWARSPGIPFSDLFGEFFFKKMLHGVLKPASYHPPVSLLSTSVTSFSRFYFQFDIPNKLFENGAGLVSCLCVHSHLGTPVMPCLPLPSPVFLLEHYLIHTQEYM